MTDLTNPNLLSIRNGLITARRVDQHRHLISGAVYQEGRLIPESERALRGAWVASNAPFTDEKPCTCLEVGIYLGHFFLHFGHFIIETLPSLYWATKVDTTILMHPWEVFAPNSLDRSFVSFSLGALNLSWKRFRFVTDEAIAVEELILPRRPLPHQPIAETLGAYHMIATAAGASPLGERIYLSRRKARSKRVLIENEIEAERVFAEFGFEVVFPETLPFRQQVAVARGAKIMAGMSGSALHLSAFMKPGTTMLVVGTRRLPAAEARNAIEGVATVHLGCTEADYVSRPQRERVLAYDLRRTIAKTFAAQFS